MRSRQSIAIDNARAALVLGVIVYHTARVFDPYHFYVKSPVTYRGLEPMILLGLLWAMPLFFLIAGYSLWHSINTRGTGRFLRERVMRLLVPFVAGLVLLVPLQIYVQRQVAGEDISYPQMLARYINVHPVAQFPIPISGQWFDMSQLWFLGYLFAFTILLVPVLLWLKHRPAIPALAPRTAAIVWLLAIALVALAESRLGTEAAGGWNHWTYFVFLVLGVGLALSPSLGEILVRGRYVLFACAIVTFTMLAISGLIMEHNHAVDLNVDMTATPVFWRALKALSASLFLMALVGSLFSYEARPAAPAGRLRSWFASLMGYSKGVALPLYIVHQAIVVVLAYWILQWPVPAPVQWLALAVLAVSFSLATVDVARRFRVGRFLLGMKGGSPKPQPQPAAPMLGHEPAQVPGPSRA